MLSYVLPQFGIPYETASARPFGSGLINNTWKVSANEREYILQRINNQVFKTPEDIAYNIRKIGDYLNRNYPEYPFVMPERTVNDEDIAFDKQHGYFRLFPFIRNSHTVDVISEPEQAYEAARQFGRFTRLLSGMEVADLKITLPDFHNITLRYRQFLQAAKDGNQERVAETIKAIETLMQYAPIVQEFEDLTHKGIFKQRVTHHDTKISNVLFNDNNEGIYVIDLDTVMPGYFISDVGDMLRTYLSPANEEEKDLGKISIREDIFAIIKAGYLSEMKDILTEEEKKYFVFAGKYMIYMQALRFLTDYLNNDAYYEKKYEGHNRVRAYNQITLLEALAAEEEHLNTL